MGKRMKKDSIMSGTEQAQNKVGMLGYLQES